jgi:Flp pilus assembly protein TadB
VQSCSSCGVKVGNESRICPRCGAFLEWQGGSIEVTGTDADEVLRVAKGLVEQRDERQQEQRAEQQRLRSPWVSGSFYLCCFIIVMAIVLVAGKVLSILALPVVVIASLLLITTVGAFQQQHDQRLSEKGFLQLMLATLKNLRLVIGRGDNRDPPE